MTAAAATPLGVCGSCWKYNFRSELPFESMFFLRALMISSSTRYSNPKMIKILFWKKLSTFENVDILRAFWESFGRIWYGPPGFLSKYTYNQMAGLADRTMSSNRNTHQKDQQKHCAHQILRQKYCCQCSPCWILWFWQVSCGILKILE